MPYRLALESKPLDLEILESKPLDLEILESKPLDLEVFDSKVHNPKSHGLDSNIIFLNLMAGGLQPRPAKFTIRN